MQSALWSDAMAREVEYIESDYRALIWALGCVWAAYVQWIFVKPHPLLITLLIAIGLVRFLPYILPFVSWFGISVGNLSPLGGGWVDVAVYISLPLMAGIATQGPLPWRIVAAAIFPFFAFLGLLITGLGSQFMLASWLNLPRAYAFLIVSVGGLVKGSTVALLFSIPAALIYRRRAISIAMLALLPALALSIRHFFEHLDLTKHMYLRVWADMWPWTCTVIVLSLCVSILNRLLPPFPWETIDTRVGEQVS